MTGRGAWVGTVTLTSGTLNSSCVPRQVPTPTAMRAAQNSTTPSKRTIQWWCSGLANLRWREAKAAPAPMMKNKGRSKMSVSAEQHRALAAVAEKPDDFLHQLAPRDRVEPGGGFI